MEKKKIDCISRFIKKAGIKAKPEDLINSFVHRSYLNETKDVSLENNERLEFLGDAVLELVSTEFLYNKYKNKSEGELTALRSALVRGKNLSGTAEKLGVFDCLFLSKGESRASGKARGLILANTIEAIIGAIYLKSSLDEARKFIHNHILSIIDKVISDKLYVDSKSEFQERTQEKEKITPHYKVVEEEGPDHNKNFISGVYIGNKLIAKGRGASKSQAEQDAARKALEISF